MGNIADHINDIDFRKHSQRSAEAITEIQGWYDASWKNACDDPDNKTYLAQMRAFSSVLWLLMKPNEYKKFMRMKKVDEAPQTEEELGYEIVSMFREG